VERFRHLSGAGDIPTRRYVWAVPVGVRYRQRVQAPSHGLAYGRIIFKAVSFKGINRLAQHLMYIADKVYAGSALWSKHGDTIRSELCSDLCIGLNQGARDAELAAGNKSSPAAVGFLQAYLTCVENYIVIMHEESRIGRPSARS
jgi:hypothetical protein